VEDLEGVSGNDDFGSESDDNFDSDSDSEGDGATSAQTGGWGLGHRR
jgi:hypothetical protein